MKSERERTGIVRSVKMNQTVIVEVTRITRHPKYPKTLRRTQRYAVHNELDGVVVGATVRIVETKPVSKTKHFKVVAVEKI